MTIDELLKKRPLPWYVEYEMRDATGEAFGSDVEVAAISDAMQELVRLRAHIRLTVHGKNVRPYTLSEAVEMSAGLDMANWENLTGAAQWCALLRARNAELEAYVVRLKAAREQLKDGPL